MSTGKVMLGLLAGVAAGAILGILFAPDKGSVTRKKLVNKGEDYADDIKEKLEDFLDGVKEKCEKVKKETSDFVEKEKATMAE